MWLERFKYEFVDNCIIMYKKKLIFDSDGLIKLIKVNLPQEVFDSFNAYISGEVYDECVTKEKRVYMMSPLKLSH